MRRIVVVWLAGLAWMATGVPASAVTTAQLGAKALSLANMPSGWPAHTSTDSAATSMQRLTSLKSHFLQEVSSIIGEVLLEEVGTDVLTRVQGVSLSG